MLNLDDPKAKEYGSSSVGGEETAMISESEEENESEKNASEKEEEEESGEVGEENIGEEEKDSGDEEKEVGEEVNEPKDEEKKMKWSPEKMTKKRKEERPNYQYENMKLSRMQSEILRKKEIASILIATATEKELLESIGMNKESCWADDEDDAAVDRWTKIIHKGKKKISLKNSSPSILGLVQLRLKVPPFLILRDHPIMQNMVFLMQNSVKAPGVKDLKALEARISNVLRDEEESDTPSEEDGGDYSLEKDKDDNASEEDGDDIPSQKDEDDGDIPSEKIEDGGSYDDIVLDITKQVQSEHGNGDDEMDDTAEMSAAAALVESEKSEKVNTEKKKKKKRVRIDDGKEIVPEKAKGWR
ncbi:unnamed protein product [Eruca vesicaria subsp. sativa]|uniref:DUF287 domain-containing protein n=1 Tax=Eruca vesicaria subsp. sativa TaxID=29727 RepID=A0ABC8LNH4_ERUVS|nr:unnamed protein product [Eruca vesicaria subsp. sativa]